MLEWDSIIYPLIEWSKGKYPARFNMTTNGTLFTEERLDYLFKHNVSFLLSMDGGKATQDLNRPMKSGHSSYDAIVKYIPKILKEKPGQTVRMTVNKSSCYNFFEDVFSLIQLGFVNISALPNVFEVWGSDEKQAFEESLKRYEEYVISGFRNGRNPVLFFGYREAYHKIKQTIRVERKGDYRNVPECIKEKQCGFGVRGSVSIDPEGNLYGCHHIAPLRREGPFWVGDIYSGLNEDRVHALIKPYEPEKVGGDKCTDCPVDWVCNGGCKPNNYQIFGDIHEVPDLFCYWERTIVQSAYRIAQCLGSEQNEAFRLAFQNSV